MKEEWPPLEKRLAGSNPPSFCIISPFRAQVEELRKALLKVWRSDSLEPVVGEASGSAQSGSAVAYELCIQQKKDKAKESSVTVHQSQGSEFDIVYFLPVDDLDWEWSWSQGSRLVNVAVSRAKKELVVVTSSGLMSAEAQRGLCDAGLLDKDCIVLPVADGSGSCEGATTDNYLYIRQLIDYVREIGEDYFPCSKGGDWGFVRSGYVSVFDALAGERKKMTGSNRRRPDGDILPVAQRNSYESLVEMYSSKISDFAVEKRVPLKELLTKEDMENKFTDDAVFTKDDKLRFIEGAVEGRAGEAPCFDFGLMDRATNKLILAIDIDDERHRDVAFLAKYGEMMWGEGVLVSPVDVLERQKKLDSMKDAVARDLGARVLHGNRKDGCCDGPANPAFTYIHLPTDGTTAWEFEELASRAPEEEFRAPFYTIEELVAEQIRGSDCRAARGGKNAKDKTKAKAKSKPSKTLKMTKLLETFKEADPSFRSMTAQKANEVLFAFGYIKHAPDGGWLVDEKGKEIGIEQARTNGYKPHCCYPPCCHEAVRKVLCETPEVG